MGVAGAGVTGIGMPPASTQTVSMKFTVSMTSSITVTQTMSRLTGTAAARARREQRAMLLEVFMLAKECGC